MVNSWGHKILAVFAITYTVALTVGSLVTPVQINTNVSHADKIVHICAYLGLTFLWFSYIHLHPGREFRKFRLDKKYFIVAVAFILYGIIIEILQGSMTDNRTPDVFDVIANTVGVIFGSLIFMLLYNKLMRLKTIN